MVDKKETKKEEMLKNLRLKDGLVSEALKISRATFKDHKEWLKDSDYSLVLEEIDQALKDMFIRDAIEMSNKGNAQVTSNVLKTFCRDRGFGADDVRAPVSTDVEIGYGDED